MKNNRIYCLLGMSGTGKTTILNLIDERNGNISRVVSYTTRPKRNGEIHGKDYYFTDNFYYKMLLNEELIVAGTEYKVANGEIWRYGLNKIYLDSNGEKIIIIEPQGFRDLKNRGYDVVGILINVEEEKRIQRIYSRKDNQGLSEITRRTQDDKKKFDKFKYDYKIENDDLMKCVEDIENIIFG